MLRGLPLGTVQALLGHTSESRNAVGRIEELLIRPKRTQMQNVAQKGSLLIH
jgi:hypothetical protein